MEDPSADEVAAVMGFSQFGSQHKNKRGRQGSSSSSSQQSSTSKPAGKKRRHKHKRSQASDTATMAVNDDSAAEMSSEAAAPQNPVVETPREEAADVPAPKPAGKGRKNKNKRRKNRTPDTATASVNNDSPVSEMASEAAIQKELAVEAPRGEAADLVVRNAKEAIGEGIKDVPDKSVHPNGEEHDNNADGPGDAGEGPEQVIPVPTPIVDAVVAKDKPTKGDYHAPNGEIFTSMKLRQLARGEADEEGIKTYFLPGFIEEDPWKGLEAVHIAATPYYV